VFSLTAEQLITLGIAGAVLIAGLLPHVPEGDQRGTYKGVAIAVGFVLGAILLAIALVEMVTD